MKTIAFYHLKGGVGKTTSAVNIAHLAAKAGVRTLLWDLDPQAAASWYLGVDEPAAATAEDVIEGRRPIGDCVQSTPYDNLSVISSHLSYRKLDQLLADAPKQRLKKLLAPLGETWSLVVLDCAPALSATALNVFRAVDAVFVPVVPSHLALRAFSQVQEFLAGKKKLTVPVYPFFTLVDRRRTLHKSFLQDPPPALEGLLKTYIPAASAVERMGEERAPLAQFAAKSPAGLSYQLLWHEVASKLKYPTHL